MQSDYTHIAVILDRTGSMETIRDDTIGGFNTFLAEQQRQPGKATLTLVQFDSQDPYEVIHSFRPIGDVPPLTRDTFVPRATTPLLDAIGRGINDLDRQLAKLGEPERPAKVVMVIVTDGHENASKEFRRDQIVKMIGEKERKLDWQFVYLSADMSAMEDAGNYGFQGSHSMLIASSPRGIGSAYLSVSERLSNYRRDAAPDMSFKEEDRAIQEEELGRQKPS